MASKTRTGARLRLLQEREVHQYFQPWLAAHGSPFSVASNVASIAVRDLQELGHSAQRSNDKTLAAFAQLATFRLNVRRAMISLIDSKHQYILTEATKTQSFPSDIPEVELDQIWLGKTILRRDEAICHHCFSNTYTAHDDNGDSYTADALVVRDCRLDERFKDRSYVLSEPGVRFYAGVPITTRDGFQIGTYAVSDEVPHDGLSIKDLKYMEHVASAIMEHLEWARDRVDRFKGERIIRGMTRFVTPMPSSLENQRKHPESKAQGYPANLSAELRSDFCEDFAPGKRMAYLIGHDPPHLDGPDSESSAESANETKAKLPDKRSKNADLAQILNRAAKSIRKCALADGVVFFGAGGGDDKTNTGANSHQESADQAVDTANVLSISIRSESHARFAAQAILGKDTLLSYFERYPTGKAFHFTAAGAEVDIDQDLLEPNNGDDLEPYPTTAGIQKTWSNGSRAAPTHEEIRAQLPGLRKLIFLPLKDFTTGKFIAGGFLWTSTLGRMMNMDDDLPHLNAFANGVVSEIVRMNVEQLSRSKTAFIASMSHELRSPLHGILGSVEFLNDTSMDTYQSGLVRSIANCSRTLLDTLSNLLSYAKVTQTSMANSTSAVDLTLLVEEVVEAVCAGHAFRQEHTAEHASTPTEEAGEPLQRPGSSESTKRASFGAGHTSYLTIAGNVSVLIDITEPGGWILRTNPGALRRVVMNLVGNALKYTTRGSICVSMRKEQRADDTCVTLKVTDTGKGISGAFLKDNLFTPFKQEDYASSGTGLGLSIVKQLVDSLGGTIEVQSQVNKGTEFTIRLPLQTSQETHSLTHTLSDGGTEELARKTKGHSMTVVNPVEDDSVTAFLASIRLRNNLSDLASSWFGFKVAKPNCKACTGSDFLMITRPVDLMAVLERGGADSKHLPKAIIVVCSSVAEAAYVGASTGSADLACVVEIISQPCGPRKLARAFERCFERLEAGEFLSPENGSTMSTTDGCHTNKSSQMPVAVPEIMTESSDGYWTSNVPIVTNDREEPATSKTVLLVEDNQINLDLLTKFMGKLSRPYTTASNGLEALNAVTDSDTGFEMILMDVSMPVMDGLEATRRVRKLEEERGCARTKVVALTGYEGNGIEERAKGAGVDMLLTKPVTFRTLKDVMDQEVVAEKPI